MPSQEESNEVATKLKAMSVMIGEMPKEFSKYSQQINVVILGKPTITRTTHNRARA